MTPGLERFNALPAGEAASALEQCFASRDWAGRVAAARPLEDFESLMAAAAKAWEKLTDADWLAAFTAHPRIGERGGHAPASSEREQRGVAQADPETLAVLAAENRRYEERFGHVFLIAASGRSAEEILRELRRRLGNDASTELREAAAEQRKITLLRLQRMLDP